MRLLAILGALLLLFTPPSLTLPTTLLRQAESLVEGREYAAALDRYNQVAALVRSPLPFDRMGGVYLRKRQLDAAEERFGQALAIDSGDARALLGLSVVHSERGGYDKAIALLGRVPRAWPYGFETRFRLGIAYLQSFDFARAEDTLDSLLTAKPNDVHAAVLHYYLGLAALERDRSVAYSHFASAAQLVSDSAVNSDASRYLADSAADSDVSDRPDLKALARVMQDVLGELRGQSNGRAHTAALLGHALLQVGEKHLARWQLEEAVAARPDSADTQAYLGYAYWLEGRDEQAMRALEVAVWLDPSRPLGHYFRGVVLRGQRRLDEAASEFLEAIRLDQGSAEAYVELGRTLVLQARYAAAGEAFERALRLRPGDEKLELLAARFYLDHAFQVERGLEIVSSVVARAPDNADVEDALGWALYLNGQADKAGQALRRAIALAPYMARPRYHLAVLLENLGDTNGAVAEYRRTIDLDLDGALAQRAAAAIEAIQRN